MHKMLVDGGIGFGSAAGVGSGFNDLPDRIDLSRVGNKGSIGGPGRSQGYTEDSWPSYLTKPVGGWRRL